MTWLCRSFAAIIVLGLAIFWLCHRAANKKPEVLKQSKWWD